MLHLYRLTAAAWLVAAATGTGLSAAQRSDRKGDTKGHQAALQAQNRAQEAAVRLADAAMIGQPVPADFSIQFQNDFLKAQQSQVWVPFTLTMDPAKVSGPATLYLRAAPRGMTLPPPADASKAAHSTDRDRTTDAKKAAPDAPIYPYQETLFLDLKPAAQGLPIRVVRGIALPSGHYDFYVVVQEHPAGLPPAAPKTSVLKQPLDVPDYSNGEFTTSTVILADRVEQLDAPIAADEQSLHPYAFGQTDIVVSPDRRFKKTQELVVLLQIYNPKLSNEKKFNIEATYTFFQVGTSGESRFNSTEPQVFNSDTTSGFDLQKTSIQAGEAIPLQSFPAGAYRLEIRVTDKLSSKIVTQNVNFTVTS